MTKYVTTSHLTFVQPVVVVTQGKGTVSTSLTCLYSLFISTYKSYLTQGEIKTAMLLLYII